MLLLRAVAERLREVVAPDDVVARHGGDESVVLCRNAARHGAERVRPAMEAAGAVPFLPPRAWSASG